MASGAGARVKHVLRRSSSLYDGAATVVTVARYLARRPHEEDFEVFRHLDSPITFADIGANRGQSAMSFAAVARGKHRIVSFEVNTRNARYLRLVRRILGARYEYHLCGLGQSPATQAFYVPVQGSRRITAEGSFRRDAVVEAAPRIDGPYEIEEETFEIRRFDSFDLRPDIVKMDVQGLELDVLIGMGDVLASAPLLMIEANINNDEAIAEHLRGYGYEPHRRVGPPYLLTAEPQPERPLNWFYAAPATAARFPRLFVAR